MKYRNCATGFAAAALLMLGSASSFALNPQPEVPSKPAPEKGRTQPKALNPQPEVPSKPGAMHETTQPKALNPQPEVPSKPKKKKTNSKKLKHPGESR